MNRVLITGVSGMLGNNLALYLRDRCDILGLYCSHPVTIEGIAVQQADLLAGDACRTTIADFGPDVVIHCASLTNVDFCETHADDARRLNVEGTAVVAAALAGSDAALVYISTDSVYDGTAGDFTEDDAVDPLNVYGRTKYEGELAAAEHPHTLVLRTNIFGWNILDKTGIGEWVLRNLDGSRPFNGFSDAMFSSIYTMRMGGVIERAVDRDLRGVYNCGSRTAMSKYDFAIGIAERLGFDASVIRPTSVLDHDFAAPRGRNLSLNVDKLEADLGWPLPTLEQCITDFCDDLRRGLPLTIKTAGGLTGGFADVLGRYVDG